MYPLNMNNWLKKLQLLLGVERSPVGALWTFTNSLSHRWKSHNCENLEAAFNHHTTHSSISSLLLWVFYKNCSQGTVTPNGSPHLLLCGSWSALMLWGNSKGVTTEDKLTNNLVNGLWRGFAIATYYLINIKIYNLTFTSVESVEVHR